MQYERFLHSAIGFFIIYRDITVFLLGFNELSRVIKLAPFDQFPYHARRKALTVAQDGVCNLGRRVLDEKYTVQNAAKVLKKRTELFHQHAAATFRYYHVYQTVVNHHNVVNLTSIFFATFLSQCRCLHQLVGNAVEGRNHHNYIALFVQGYLLQVENSFYRTHRGSSEFQYFHMNDLLIIK